MLEALQNSAEVAGIQLQFAAELGGGEVAALGEFIEHARLGQGEAAVQQALLQRADDARVGAAEPADRGDALRECTGSAMPKSYDYLTWSSNGESPIELAVKSHGREQDYVNAM